MQNENKGYSIDPKGAVEFEQSSSMCGAYVMKVKEAVTGLSNSGARWLDMRIEIPSRLDSDGNPKEYSIQRVYLTSGKAKGYIKTFRGNQLDSLMLLLNAKPTVAKRKALVWEDKVQVEKSVDQFTDVLNKPIGGVIQMRYIWRRKRIEGYSKLEAILEDPTRPDHVWIDNYDENSILTFEITCWFMPEGDHKGYTYSEIVNSKEVSDFKPKNLARAIKRVFTYEYDKDGNPELKKLTNEQMYDFIQNQLKKQLTAAGLEFNKDEFAPYKGSELEDLEDIPFA